jgi:putative nucleotidyltransferase with HDIG domain
MKLCLLIEGAKEEAAIALIRDSINGTQYDGKVYIAGGFVRDELLGKPSKDIDLVIDEEDGGIRFAIWICKKLGIYKENSNPVIYPRFGTAMFTFRHTSNMGQDLSDLDIECVKPRKDESATGLSRKDVVTAQGTMEDDAKRRDLTINALYKNVTTGEIFDPTGMGLDDLRKKVIRTPIDPDETFGYPPVGDPLRMLRAIRFYSKFGYDIDPSVINGIKKNLDKISGISFERVSAEFSKMLTSARPVESINLLIQTGLIDYIIPELRSLIGLEQGIYHNKDAYGHTMDVLAKSSPRLNTRLAALLHDIGKPDTRQPHERKQYEFIDHEIVGAEKAKNILRRLRYPNETISAVAALIERHMALRSGKHGDISDKTLRRFKSRCNELGIELDDALDLMQADFEAHPGADLSLFDSIRKRYSEMSQTEASVERDIISGADIIAAFGVKPGPMIGVMKKYIKELQLDDPSIDKETALLKLKEKFNPHENI